MNGQPDPIWLGAVAGLGCAAVSLVCHKLVRGIESNRIMSIYPAMEKQAGNRFWRGYGQGKDAYTQQFALRSILHIMLLMWKWVLAFSAVLMGFSTTARFSYYLFTIVDR